MHNTRRLRRTLLPWAAGCLTPCSASGPFPARRTPIACSTTIDIPATSSNTTGDGTDRLRYRPTSTAIHRTTTWPTVPTTRSTCCRPRPTPSSPRSARARSPGEIQPRYPGPNGVSVANNQLMQATATSTVHVFNISGTDLCARNDHLHRHPCRFTRRRDGIQPTDNRLIVANDAPRPRSPYVSLITRRPMRGGADRAQRKQRHAQRDRWHRTINGCPATEQGLHLDPADPRRPVIQQYRQDRSAHRRGPIQTFDLSSFAYQRLRPAGLVKGNGRPAPGRVRRLPGRQTIVYDPTANGGAGAVIGDPIPFSGADEVAFDRQQQPVLRHQFRRWAARHDQRCERRVPRQHHHRDGRTFGRRSIRCRTSCSCRWARAQATRSAPAAASGCTTGRCRNPVQLAAGGAAWLGWPASPASAERRRRTLQR